MSMSRTDEALSQHSENPSSTAPRSPSAGLREERRRHRMELSRNHILDVAEALFSEQGYHQTSLEQVAAGSEYSVGSLYTFFDGKKELLAAVLERRQTEMAPRVVEIQAADQSGLDELLALCAHSVEYMRQHPTFARLTMRVYQAGLEASPGLPINRGDQSAGRSFTQVVQKGQRDGTIRAGGVVWLATLIEGAIMFDQLARDNAPDEDEPAENLLDVIRRAVSA
jgi:AcrR family transcriptional regulator